MVALIKCTTTPDSKSSFSIQENSEGLELYENGKAKNQSCPKCGPGVFLANHKDRLTCGSCGYVEMKGKPKEEASEEKKEESKEEPKEEKKE